ncbi:PhzF family phenazine biosynthesis protein [Spirosoma koreense]
MSSIPYFIVDVFASAPYEGNQLAVFLDLENKLSETQMQRMAREINFAESTFVKANKNNQRFVVRIFTPEHEVPFAGHPSLGTSYVLAKFILPEAVNSLTLELIHWAIDISIQEPADLDNSIFYMHQTQPDFREVFDKAELAAALGIGPDSIDASLPIQEISTGLPYILVPLSSLAAIEAIELSYPSFKNFLISKKKYRTNSPTGHSTSLFFFTRETYDPAHEYNTRMMLIENNKVTEDAATGSANGCLLAYLLLYDSPYIQAVVEQGFQINRKSYIYLDGEVTNERYSIRVGGTCKLIAEGKWYVD